MPAPIPTDALVIGAGPVGLFAVFQLGLQGVHAHVVDTLPHAGGQCVALYGHKPIYDIPGIPRCTGQELTNQLLQQIAPFQADFHYEQCVSQLEQQADGRWLVHTHAAATQPQAPAQSFLAKTIFIAAGVGAFQPRMLSLEGASALEGQQIHYALDHLPDVSGQHVMVLGDSDAAVQAALQLAEVMPASQRPARVRLVHRREVLSAEPDTLERLRNRLAEGALDFVVGQVHALHTSPRLHALDLLRPDAQMERLPVDTLLVLQGLTPKLGPIADWGLALERRQLVVAPESCATSADGIFAIGDINHYPGKKKLILCGFHECVLAVFAAMPFIRPGPAPALQYTTTSSLLHQRLGVS